jgi:hypothetical protein
MRESWVMVFSQRDLDSASQINARTIQQHFGGGKTKEPPIKLALGKRISGIRHACDGAARERCEM